MIMISRRRRPLLLTASALVCIICLSSSSSSNTAVVLAEKTDDGDGSDHGTTTTTTTTTTNGNSNNHSEKPNDEKAARKNHRRGPPPIHSPYAHELRPTERPSADVSGRRRRSGEGDNNEKSSHHNNNGGGGDNDRREAGEGGDDGGSGVGVGVGTTRPTSTPTNPDQDNSNSNIIETNNNNINNKGAQGSSIPSSSSSSATAPVSATANLDRKSSIHRARLYTPEFSAELRLLKDAGASEAEIHDYVAGRQRELDARMRAEFEMKEREGLLTPEEMERVERHREVERRVEAKERKRRAAADVKEKEKEDWEEEEREDAEKRNQAFVEREKMRRAAAAAAAADADDGNVPSEEEEGGGRSARPSSRPASFSSDPASAPVESHRRRGRYYDSVFRPLEEEYDMTNFDPYSFSGAPLGGWGRATRSRLASLPVRLVSDFGGGMDLIFGGGGGGAAAAAAAGSGTAVEEGVREEGEDEAVSRAEGSAATEQTADEASESKALPKELQLKRPSIGPHYSIHDSTGQKYVCRAYDEDELVVPSRLDSVFHPAVTVWDDALGVGGGKSASTDGGGAEDYVNGSAEEEDQGSEEEEEGGADGRKHFQFSINDKGGASGDLPSNIRESVTKILRNMGMDDAAAALEGREHPAARVGLADAVANVDVDVRVVDLGVGDLDVAAAEAGGNRGGNGIADIIKAAAVGAGMDSTDDNDEADGGKDGGGDGGDGAIAERPPPAGPAQLSLAEIHAILSKLDNLCSQLHLGWWSYEWCHQEQIRQFHVAVNVNLSAEEHRNSGGQPKYTIEDVTSLGKFDGEVQIVYPKGEYGGEWVSGKTTTVKFDAKGNVRKTDVAKHTVTDDEKYSKAHQAKDGIRKLNQRNNQLGHGGPIIRQKFEGGGYCEEVGRKREMNVELRCCTEDEIDHWLESKKQPGGNKKSANKKEGKTLPAVLVSVQEEETCVYRSRVCTPLLCPKPVDGKASLSDGGGASATKSKATPKIPATKEQLKENQDDPIGALLTAIFGEDMDLVGEHGQVQVFFPDDDTGRAFDDLIRQAENGIDFVNNPSFELVKKAMRKSKMSNKKKLNVKDLIGDGTLLEGGGSRSAEAMEVKDGQSIREILSKTLGARPCLIKNLGWWTYEFCHTNQIRQYHANNLIDANTGFAKQTIETEHILGVYEGSGNDIKDYPNEDEHLHVVNATGSNTDLGIGNRKNAGNNKNGKHSGGTGAVYIQEYMHGDVCDNEDVAESVIKGGDVLHGSVQRSSTVRFSCGKRWEMKDIKEDSTCHYILDVTVPELCQHRLFKAPVTKTQVVKCLPV